MKILTILLVTVELVYVLTLKLASFMISLLAIVFVTLFLHNMIWNRSDPTEPTKYGARI